MSYNYSGNLVARTCKVFIIITLSFMIALSFGFWQSRLSIDYIDIGNMGQVDEVKN